MCALRTATVGLAVLVCVSVSRVQEETRWGEAHWGASEGMYRLCGHVHAGVEVEARRRGRSVGVPCNSFGLSCSPSWGAVGEKKAGGSSGHVVFGGMWQRGRSRTSGSVYAYAGGGMW
ncbi:hypothetical protein K438DRAFT_1786225 [Mycena galopus ATCC 62051]|nr:hypothetical protein K438DRAFT_1786225 [Mycena galopus ATCC 62051]